MFQRLWSYDLTALYKSIIIIIIIIIILCEYVEIQNPDVNMEAVS